MRPPTAVPPRSSLKPGQVALLVVAMVVAALFIVVMVVFRLLSSPYLDYACSWPGQRVLAGREGFVRAHFGDASDFEVATYDCEDGGSAHLAFSTGLDPLAARDALLTDPACRPFHSDGSGNYAVACGTKSNASFLFFDTASDGVTSGEVQLG